ncbi:MBL fold metallo-hydrolase [Candidatus Foliamicus sp.]
MPVPRKPIRPGEIVRLAPDIHRITAFNAGMMTGPGTNTWILGERDLAVLDPGPASRKHVDNLLAKAPGRIRWVLVTHTHADHSPAAALLAERTGATVIGPAPPPAGRQDRSFRPSQQPGHGEQVELGGVVLKAVHTPGHASNHFCWWFAAHGVLFTGDHVMQGSTVVIAPPDGNMTDYMRSLRRVLKLPLEALAPGHGHWIDRPRAEIAALIAHREAREAKVMAVLDRIGPVALGELVPRVYDDVAERLHSVAALSLEAHLHKLEAEGKARCRTGRWRASAQHLP